MFLFRRKAKELETNPAISRKVKLGRDTIALGSLFLDVEQEGNFYIEDTLTINANACIIGNITATRCIIEGRVIGNVICTEDLQLGITAVIEGSIMTKAAVIEAGCIIKGKVMLDPNLKVSLLSLKIAEAKNYLEKENTNSLSDLDKVLEIPKRDSNILQNTHSQNEKHLVSRKQNPVYVEPTNQTDNWW